MLLQVSTSIMGHGLGRHSESDIIYLVDRDLAALSTILGDKPFVTGEAAHCMPAARHARAYVCGGRLTRCWLLHHACLVCLQAPRRATATAPCSPSSTAWSTRPASTPSSCVATALHCAVRCQPLH